MKANIRNKDNTKYKINRIKIKEKENKRKIK
jgi:hypothetical protein